MEVFTEILAKETCVREANLVADFFQRQVGVLEIPGDIRKCVFLNPLKCRLIRILFADDGEIFCRDTEL